MGFPNIPILDPQGTADWITSMGGGETSEQKRIRKDQQSNIEQGYNEAEQAIENQYYGGAASKAERRAELERLLNDPVWANSSAPGDVALREDLQRQIDEIDQEIQAELNYSPEIYTPQTDYEVTGYDPTMVTPTSEAKVAHLVEALFPEKYGIPEYEDAAMQGPSEAARARRDEESWQAATGALGSLQDIYQQGGMTAADRARQEQIQRSNAQQERAAREAILANAAERGQATSGTNIMALLNAAQNTADRNRDQSMDVEMLAEQRALNAMREAGMLGRGLASDEFGRQYATGSAQDEINRFNTLGARDVQAAARNAADAYRGWNRDIVGRDVEALNAADRYNADAQTAADQWMAGERTAESQWGANTGNSAAKYNADMETAARRAAADRAWQQLMGYNTQQGSLGNIALGRAGAQNQLIAGIPTTDYGQFTENAGKVLSDPMGGTDTVSKILNGVQGAQGGGGGGASKAETAGKVAAFV